MKNYIIHFTQHCFLSKMKTAPSLQVKKVITLFLFALFGFSICTQAQFFKKMAKKIENKLEPGSINDTAVVAKPYNYTIQSTPLKIPASAADYMWFKKGSKFYYKTINTDPSKSSQSEFTVKNVYNQDNMVVSEMEIRTSINNMFVNDGADYMKFKCSEDSIYIDFSAELKKALLKMNPALSVNQLAETGFLSVPVKMVEGQALPDVSFSRESGLNEGEMLSTSLTKRKIEGKEKITTPAGTFDCVKITGTRNSSTTKQGVTKPSFETTIESIWLAPKVGIVKQESYSTKGKLIAIEYLTLFKK